MNFPYAAILRNAYELTRNHFQLWVFGIFISAATWLNFLLLNIAFDRRELVDFDSSEFVSKLQSIADSPLAIANLFVVVIILFFSALSKATVVWSAQKLAGRQQWASDQKKEFSVKTALKEGGKYAGTIFWLQLLVLFLLLLLVISIAAPVVYLAVIGQIGRAVALTFLGMAILVPVSILLGYMFIYSPIFAVLYRVKARAALGLAFGLAQNKLKESLILGAFLVGIRANRPHVGRLYARFCHRFSRAMRGCHLAGRTDRVQ